MARLRWYLKERGWEVRDGKVYVIISCPKWALPLWLLDGAWIALKRWWRERRRPK